MNLDEATNEFNRVNKACADLLCRRDKLSALVLKLQNDVRNDDGISTSVFRMDDEKLVSLSPREQFKEDTKDMWKQDYSSVEREASIQDLSPRENLANDLKDMCK